MGICYYCEQNILLPETDTCAARSLSINLISYEQIRFGLEKHWSWRAPERCPTCFVMKEGLHHPPCSFEQCPRCGGRLANCKCPWEVIVERFPGGAAIKEE